MIKLNLRLTWPALILILIALLVWLARDPASHATGTHKPAPSRRRPASPPRRPFVIDQDGKNLRQITHTGVNRYPSWSQ